MKRATNTTKTKKQNVEKEVDEIGEAINKLHQQQEEGQHQTFRRQAAKKSEVQFHKFDKKDPIYYNLTLNKGFTAMDNTGFNTPANFNEINSQPILFEAGDWFISLMRCSIPTGIIPRYIYPIQTGPLQSNINLTYNTFTFRYATAPGVYVDTVLLSNEQQTALFQSELLRPKPVNTDPYFAFPLPPSQNGGVQDVSGAYYFIYFVESVLKMLNDTLASLWATYIAAIFADHAIVLPAGYQPFFTYDSSSQLFSFNAPVSIFDLDVYPHVEVFSDDLTAENTIVPFDFNVTPISPWDITRLRVVNLRNNIVSYNVGMTPTNYYKMESDQSGVVAWASFQKIIFEVTGDIALKHNETDAIPLNFQGSTTAQSQKPLLSMLTDIEVDSDAFAKNSSFIQYQQSSIEEVRLIRLSNRNSIQNFKMSIYWIDNYGTRRLLSIPSIGNPLTIKLAFFNKDFKD